MNGLFWILIASVIGYAVAVISTDMLKLRRNFFLMIYIPVVSILFLVFIRSNSISISELVRHNLLWGLLGAALAGVFVLKNVFSQPSSPSSKGSALFVDIAWPGLLYGLMGSIFLSIIPVLALRLTLADIFWVDNIVGKISFGALALLASFVVTTAYHWGFPEFRGKKIIWPNIGNGVLTLALLLTMNPLAAILPHMAMHIAAMIHGRETTGQVPPHYDLTAGM